MASYTDTSISRSHAMTTQDHIEVIWQMGMTSLFSNNNQIIIPLYMADTLGETGIIELKSRLSQLFGNAPATAYRDFASNVMRICLVSDHLTSGIAYASPPASTPSPQSTTSATAALSDVNARSPGKKARVPRPPNAFILYRKEHHPKLKAENPDLHNNDISVILGKQWGMEPPSVKDKYKARAGVIKRKHAAENPGYQYAPRKPSEKKRRMTARKMAQLQAVAEEELQSSPTSNIIDLTENEHIQPVSIMTVVNGHETGATAADLRQTPSAAEELGLQCPKRGNISGPSGDGDMTVLMPASRPDFSAFQKQFNDHLAPAQEYGLLSFDAFNRETMAAEPARHNLNDQDFLNSLIDWEGIQADAEMIHQMTTDDRAELVGTEMAGPSLLFADDAAAKFQAELDRVRNML